MYFWLLKLAVATLTAGFFYGQTIVGWHNSLNIFQGYVTIEVV
jgi:hypothetical protein